MDREQEIRDDEARTVIDLALLTYKEIEGLTFAPGAIAQLRSFREQLAARVMAHRAAMTVEPERSAAYMEEAIGELLHPERACKRGVINRLLHGPDCGIVEGKTRKGGPLD